MAPMGWGWGRLRLRQPNRKGRQAVAGRREVAVAPMGWGWGRLRLRQPNRNRKGRQAVAVELVHG